jgi:hypothetical protein
MVNASPEDRLAAQVFPPKGCKLCRLRKSANSIIPELLLAIGMAVAEDAITVDIENYFRPGIIAISGHIAFSKGRSVLCR